MASMYDTRYLGELQKVTTANKGSPASAQLLVSADLARQAALSTASKWRFGAVVLAGLVLALVFTRRH